MEPKDPNDFNGCPIPLDFIRFIRELFSVPERAFAYLALHSFNWPAAKFVEGHRDLTLKEIEKLFERHLVWSGYARSLVSHIFQPLRNLLRQPPARDRPSGDNRPLGAYRLCEFFTHCGADDVGNWCRLARARIDDAREKARIGDARFASFWREHHGQLVRVLHRFVHGHHTSPEDIAHSTWLAILIAHDTGADWDFAALLRVALDLYRREPSGRGLELEFLDQLAVDDAREDGTPWLRVPVYVKIALLETLFDGACLPHEVITFFCRWLVQLPPRSIVESFGARTLFDLSSEILAAYLPRATVPEPAVRQGFARFDARLDCPFDQITRNARRLRTYRRLLRKFVGWTRLKDYFRRRSALGRATEVGHWCDSVLKYLKNQATTPGTPLFLAILRWRDEDFDFDEHLEQNHEKTPGLKLDQTPDQGPRKKRRKRPRAQRDNNNPDHDPPLPPPPG